MAQVAPALTAALSGRVEVISLPMPQPGARWPLWLKPLVLPSRVIVAFRLSRRVRRLHADLLHIHWLPNGVVGLLANVPWVLHLHGSDVRRLGTIRRPLFNWLLRRASAVVYATPDLAADVLPIRPDATLLPAPINVALIEVAPEWDVLFAPRSSDADKGSSMAFEALSMIHERRPDLRLAALDGPDFREGVGVRRLPVMPKWEFHRLLASARVVIGQLRYGELGIAELEALALGRPLVMPVAYDAPVLQARTATEIAQAVCDVLDGRRDAPDGSAWVAQRHGAEQIGTRLVSLYSALMEAQHGR